MSSNTWTDLKDQRIWDVCVRPCFEPDGTRFFQRLRARLGLIGLVLVGFLLPDKKNYRDHPDDGNEGSNNEKIEVRHRLNLAPDKRMAPSDRMDGTQRPVYKPSTLSPVNQR